MAEPTIAAGFARGLVEVAVARGADREILLGRAGIGPAQLEDQDRRLPLATYKRLMREAKALTGDPALALHFGEAFQITELSIIGLMGQSSASYAEAFAQFARYSRLAVDVELEPEAGGNRYVLRPDAQGLWVVDMRKDPNDFPELTESAVARMAASAPRFSAGAGSGLLRAIHFTHDEPPYRSEYDRIFGVPLVFGSDRNALLLASDAWLAQQGPAPSPYMAAILRERAEALLEELDAASSVRRAVERLLPSLLHSGDGRMEAVARRLGVSRATLFRRLRAEGTSFERLLDDVRRRLGLDYVVEKRLPVGEAAYLLGFAEPASFSRAFKRWTGKSPRNLRG